ncbi:hypothetical protein COCVIDRAFT_83914 [Bipolaris victoriae FI3]|uniref:Uncharacterized protein n=1 Tax=Bipolaris victoriae (strain FI3) TaxID=930091 RepID=W7ERM0_BIPV3|nr:hypothetical protein COCVIDRAFT_83914 [Bipolaris victoriae FI3]
MMSIYDIPPSPPQPVHVRVHTNSKHKNKSQHLSDTTRIIPSKRKPGASFKTEKAKKHLTTRKRRLPVHQLALLRTTTSDGLPQSSDMEVTFSDSIAVTDPIEDSQFNRPITRPLGGLMCNIVTLGKRGFSHTMQHSDMRSTPIERTPNRASIADETPKGTRSPILKQIRDVCVTQDGHIDHELQTASRGQPDRRGNYVSIRRKRPAVVHTLTLGSGLLPSPTDKTPDTSYAIQRKRPIPGSRNLYRLENRPIDQKSTQLTLVNSSEYLRRLPVLSPPRVSCRGGP